MDMRLGREGGHARSQQNLAAKTSYKYAVIFQKYDKDQKYVHCLNVHWLFVLSKQVEVIMIMLFPC